MELYPSNMVAEIQADLRDSLGRSATVQVIGQKLNRSLRDLAGEIRKIQPNAFKVSTTVNVVAGTADYDLPLDCPPNGITNVEPLSSSISTSKKYVRFSDRNRYVGGDTYYYTVTHTGRRLRLTIVPTPTQAETVTVWYTRAATPMQYGTAGSMTASTIRLPASPTMGRRYLESFEPVGAYILISSGAAIGDVRRIVGYSVVTRFASVDTNFTSITGTQVYEILPAWVSDDCGDFLVADVLRRENIRNKNDASDLDVVRGRKLEMILEQWRTLQRTEQHRIGLKRGYARADNVNRLPRDVDNGW